MREILFRGKSLDFGDWLCGYIRQYENGKVTVCDFERKRLWFVNPSTVGQFTGLTDKNGKRIFEGDIVEGHCHSAWRHDIQRCEVAYGRDGFEARHHVMCGGEQRYYTYKVLFSKDVVVIGNIHDNPELIGERKDNEG